MYDCFITFRSITTAQRGEYVLKQIGMRGLVTRRPMILSQQGCGYSLRVASHTCAAAVRELRQQGIPIGKVYCQKGENFQEVPV